MKKLLIYIVMCLWAIGSQANSEKYYSLFMYNFTKYMEWPGQSGDFVIVVVGKSSITPFLKAVSANKTVGTQQIVIKEVGSIAEAKGAQMIYLPSSENSSLAEASSMAISSKALLVCEKSGSAKNGAGISFKESGGKMSFEINKANLTKAGIKVNAKLEQLGDVVG